MKYIKNIKCLVLQNSIKKKKIYNFLKYQKRIENCRPSMELLDFGKNKIIFNFFFFFSKFLSFEKKKFIYTFYLVFFFFYKGWRIFKGYPSNGQRTRSNGISCYKNNLYFKYNKIINLNNNLDYKNIGKNNVFFLIEYYNLLLKTQWYDEWLFLKKNRLIFLKKKKFKKNFISEDLILGELLYVRNKFLKKKVKVQFKGDSYLLGFDPGIYLNYNN